MIVRTGLIALLFFLLGMTGCNKETQDKYMAMVPEDISDVTITMSRGACYGECPVYQLTINGAGSVQYTGEKFVALTGEKSYEIPETKVRELIAAFYAADYFSLKDQYLTKKVTRTTPSGEVIEAVQEVTDLPVTTTSITIGGKTKTVANCFDAPVKLRELENHIDRVCGAEKLVK